MNAHYDTSSIWAAASKVILWQAVLVRVLIPIRQGHNSYSPASCSSVTSTAAYLQVTVHDFGNQGRGLVATTNVQKGALLLAIPKDLVIFPQTAATGETKKQLIT